MSAVVPGENAPDAASFLNTAHPHPPLSANLWLSFTMKSTSCWVPGTVVFGEVLVLFRAPMDLRHLGAVGERLAVAGNAGQVSVDHHGISKDRSDQLVVLTDGNNLPAFVSP